MQLNLISTCTFTCQRVSPRPQTSLFLQICSKQFRSQVGFQQHLRTHTGDLFPCNVCGEKFQSKHSASRHEKDLHGVFGQSKDDQQKVWRCGVVSCGAEFNGEEEQRLHARTAHQSRSSVLICKMCRKICTNRAALRSHMQKLHPGKGKREVNLKWCKFFRQQHRVEAETEAWEKSISVERRKRGKSGTGEDYFLTQFHFRPGCDRCWCCQPV